MPHTPPQVIADGIAGMPPEWQSLAQDIVAGGLPHEVMVSALEDLIQTWEANRPQQTDTGIIGLNPDGTASPGTGEFAGPVFGESVFATFATPISAIGEALSALPSSQSQGVPLGAGFDLLERQLQLLFDSAENRRAEDVLQLQQQQQGLSFASFFTDLMNADPVQAANLAFQLGIPIGNPFRPVIDALASGQAPQQFGGLPPQAPTFVGGEFGTVPTSFRGAQAEGIQSNPLLRNLILSLNRQTGVGDTVQQSLAARIPFGSLPGQRV